MGDGQKGKGRARAFGNFPRRHRGHALCAGHFNGARRHDVACGGRGARHGHVLRFGLRRDKNRRRKQGVHARRKDLPRGRLHFPRRFYGQHIRRRDKDGGRHGFGRFRPHYGVGGQVPQTAGAHQRRHPEGCETGPRVRRGGHRPLQNGAHVL